MPTHNKILTAQFDGKGKQLFANLKDTSNLVLLSIKGNTQCEGQHLTAITREAIKYGRTTFLIADTLHKYNLQARDESKSIEDCIKDAAILGDEYININYRYILEAFDGGTKVADEINSYKASDKIGFINTFLFDKNINIVRWSDWTNNYEHKDDLSEIINTTRHDESLMAVFNSAANDYITKKKSKHPEWNLDDETFQKSLTRASIEYFLEEYSLIAYISTKQQINFISYPGKKLNAFDNFANKVKERLFNHIINDDERRKEMSLYVNWLHIKCKETSPKSSPKQSITNTPPPENVEPFNLDGETIPTQENANSQHIAPNARFFHLNNTNSVRHDVVSPKTQRCMHYVQAFTLTMMSSAHDTGLIIEVISGVLHKLSRGESTDNLMPNSKI